MASIFVVEDEEIIRCVLEKSLGERHRVYSFATAEECLARIAGEGQDVAVQPDLFLFDVGLPGMDGFALCQHLKAQPGLEQVPVIFLSGLVEIDARIRGYDVGAHDFIVKPFDVRELKQKVDILLALAESHSQLRNQLNDSDTLTSLILSNLDEYAVLLNYLRSLNSCNHSSGIAALTHTMLREFGLSGVIQLRLPEGDLTRDGEGNCTPLMESVMNHVRTLSRIFEFKKHGVYNFHRITLMVDNMPTQDPELCGRLRDHLAIAIETADERLAGLLATESILNANESVEEILTVLHGTIAAFTDRAKYAQQAAATVMLEMGNEMSASFAQLGLNLFQEESLLEMVKLKAHELVAIYNSTNETNQTLSEVEQRLQEIQTALKANVSNMPKAARAEEAASVSTVELF